MSTNSSRRWWLIGGAWALLLLALGVWSSMRGSATVPDQSPIATGKMKIDQVVGQVNASVPAGWLVDDGGYLETTCRRPYWHHHVAASRTLTLSGPAGTERDALSKVASALDNTHVADNNSFFYDAGDFIAVRAEANGAGTIVMTLSTGCRPQ